METKLNACEVKGYFMTIILASFKVTQLCDYFINWLSASSIAPSPRVTANKWRVWPILVYLIFDFCSISSRLWDARHYSFETPKAKISWNPMRTSWRTMYWNARSNLLKSLWFELGSLNSNRIRLDYIPLQFFQFESIWRQRVWFSIWIGFKLISNCSNCIGGPQNPRQVINLGFPSFTI